MAVQELEQGGQVLADFRLLADVNLPVIGGEMCIRDRVGMAAFFAVAAQAPLTALVMVVEFSMSGEMIYPLLIGVVSAYGTVSYTHLHVP